MDTKTLIAIVGGAIAYLLYQMELRIRSFENRLIICFNAQNSLMRETMEEDIEVDFFADDDDDEPEAGDLGKNSPHDNEL